MPSSLINNSICRTRMDFKEETACFHTYLHFSTLSTNVTFVTVSNITYNPVVMVTKPEVIILKCIQWIYHNIVSTARIFHWSTKSMQGKELSLYHCCITLVANSSDKTVDKLYFTCELTVFHLYVNSRLLEIFILVNIIKCYFYDHENEILKMNYIIFFIQIW